MVVHCTSATHQETYLAPMAEDIFQSSVLHVSFAAFGSLLDLSWKYYNTLKIKYKSVDTYEQFVHIYKQVYNQVHSSMRYNMNNQIKQHLAGTLLVLGFFSAIGLTFALLCMAVGV